MEEASVAGESPDRSKQRESSAEPTSGSAGPVPEARAGSRDPRLSVAREDSKPSTARGGVDTATKIFSVRDLPRDTTDPTHTTHTTDSADISDAPGTPDAPVTPAAEPEGDARLREAVADDDKGATPASGDASAGDDDHDVTGADSGAEVTSVALADVDADVDAKANTGDVTSADGRTADGNKDEDPDADGEPNPDAADATAEVEAEDPKVEAGTEAEAEAEDPAETAGAESKAPADSEPEAADGEDAPQGPPAPDDESSTRGGAGGDGKADGEAEVESPQATNSTPADAPSPSPAPVDHPTAIFKAVRPPEPAADQPTAMLKLGGTPKPTTPTPAPAKRTADPRRTEPTDSPKLPESEAERTSKFVALKPLDAPRPRPEATRPLPQVGPERTTQQPLPPKPPLDLLAELTNTPPPPETPVRTIVRRVKIWTPLVILLAIVFAVVQAVRPLPAASLTLTADDSYTFDGKQTALPWPSEGQGWLDVNGIGTMGSFGKQTPVAIGSVAKAMTAYIVLKDHPLKSGAEGAKIKVDATAEKEGGYDKNGESTLNTVKAGDVLTEKQALSAIMIPSANNIARLLARWDAGSEAAFIKKMNATAKKLGMTHTTYTDASGLKETTVSSSGDQVKLGNELVKLTALTDITKLPTWADPSGKKWTNYNRLVPYNGAIGLKTGTTTAAGGNLLFAATKQVGGETVTVVGAILGQHTAPIIDTVNAVSKTAMLGAQSALTSAKILKKGDVVGYVDDQLGNHTPVVLTKDVAAVGWAGLKVKLSFDPDDVPHTAKAGTRVGTLTVGDGSGGAVKVPVALQKDLTEPGFTDRLARLG